MDLSNQPNTQRSLTAIAFCIVAALAFLNGCAEKNSADRSSAETYGSFVDESIASFHNLGWLGAQSHPLNKPLSFPDPEDEESSVSPGGLVISKVFDESIAAAAKLSVGDVVVGVGEDWLPIKDDPTIDFIRLIEEKVAGDQDSIQLRVFNGTSLRSVSIKPEVASLEPVSERVVPRYQAALLRGLEYLASRQNENGSIGASKDATEKLRTTCIAGLSFLSAPEGQFKQNVDKCLEFVGAELDKRSEAGAHEPAGSAAGKPSASGVVMMKMSEIDIDPLTAAYVIQLFAESDLQVIAPQWMPRIMGTIQALSKSQSESGDWNAGSSEESGEVDVAWATFTTNQVLLGLGMLERKGMNGDSEMIKKACEYLKSVAKERASTSMDRRLKTSLTAGTAAALLSINCKATDAFLKQAVEDGLTRIGECPMSPRLTLVGSLATALLARQTSPEAWEQFHSETKYWLSSLQLPDGTFQSIPTETSDGDNADLESAYYCLLLSMPSDSLSRLKAEATSPMMVARNSDGEEVEGSKTAATSETPAGIPAGAKVMSFSMDDLSGEGSLEDQIKEKLKSMGVEGDIKIGGSAPDKDE